MALRFERLESKEMLTGAPAPSENLGALTNWAIHELDFDQGQHASDPSGDGHGPWHSRRASCWTRQCYRRRQSRSDGRLTRYAIERAGLDAQVVKSMSSRV